MKWVVLTFVALFVPCVCFASADVVLLTLTALHAAE
jgi:hypothetical protein